MRHSVVTVPTGAGQSHVHSSQAFAVNDASPFRLPRITPGLIAAFADRLLDGAEAEALALADELLGQGISHEALMLDLLAPAARRMGEGWCSDERDFVEVTLGMARLQRLLRQLRMGTVCNDRVKGNCLLFPVPGEQHSFGVRLVEEHLLRAGWKASAVLVPTEEDIRALVLANYYDFVGISLTSDRLLPDLRSAIRCVRTYSRNPRARIMVGGVLFNGRLSPPTGIDADAIVQDARQAVAQAEDWLGMAETE